jgi:hypothetical protein
MTNQNPLAQFFRQPSIYLRLPSGGRHYPTGALDMPPNQELPVYPMTARDEITYRTPDALFNGSAVVSVVKSCVPNIKDPWCMPSSDVDAVLIAIRIATYGHDMELPSTCPSCQTETDYSIDLRAVNDQIKLGDFDKSLQIGDLEIYFAPISYRQINENNQKQFEQQQLIRQLDSITDDQQRASVMAQALNQITEITSRAIANSIAAIKTPNALVSEQEFIAEFIANCDRKVFTTVKDHAINLKQQSEVKPLSLKCPNCEHQYQQPFTLDMTSFFVDGS